MTDSSDNTISLAGIPPQFSCILKAQYWTLMLEKHSKNPSNSSFAHDRNNFEVWNLSKGTGSFVQRRHRASIAAVGTLCTQISANRHVDQTNTAGHADLVNTCPIVSKRLPQLWLFRQQSNIHTLMVAFLAEQHILVFSEASPMFLGFLVWVMAPLCCGHLPAKKPIFCVASACFILSSLLEIHVTLDTFFQMILFSLIVFFVCLLCIFLHPANMWCKYTLTWLIQTSESDFYFYFFC